MGGDDLHLSLKRRVYGAMATALLMLCAACSSSDKGADNTTDTVEPLNVVGAAAKSVRSPNDDNEPPLVKPTPAPPGTAMPPLPPREGHWSFQEDSNGAAALFGSGSDDASLSVRCDRADNALTFSRPDEEATAPVEILNLSLPAGSTLVRVFREDDGKERSGGSARYSGKIPLRAPWLSTLMQSSGTLETDLGGRVPLSVPVEDALKQVVARCRDGERE